MKRYDEYVKGNDTPQTLCAEIDRLRNWLDKAYTELNNVKAWNKKNKELISKLKCCGNCKYYRVKYEDCVLCSATYNNELIYKDVNYKCDKWEFEENDD